MRMGDVEVMLWCWPPARVYSCEPPARACVQGLQGAGNTVAIVLAVFLFFFFFSGN